ncbi:RagB/SusD family nutrient uptake outer membrane protein [Pedobacter sp. JY14-1]|uniref:RagB/SusD family nutrient uptake outer membrane protein n=1 Tax=Pedobacter sp. JY14-1 TaxID=3034151 RepID=UPI0023E32B94|nr:RagB/SusD family nutrient uptake outer membrane protein [Pedobacter sp. JY14-1]
MRNRILYSLLLLISIHSFVSCKKSFLDVASVTSPLYRENYVRDLNSMEEYLNGMYLLFAANWFGGSSEKGYAEYVADNLKPINTNDANIIANYKWMQNQYGGNAPDFTSTNMSLNWQRNYRVIRASCFITEDIGKYRKENPVKADYIKGQALFFRAIMHFKLVNMFAQPYKFTPDASHLGVPYITTSNLSAPYSRQSVKQVYDAIITDLNEAISLMNNTATPDVRYVGIDAVRGILARVYLFKGDYTKALDIARDLCVKYPLMTIAKGYPNLLYSHQTESGSEVIFQATPGGAYPNTTAFLGRYLKGALLSFYATSDIAGILKESVTDARSAWVTSNGSNWLVTKFPSGVAGIPGALEGDYYDPVIRSSEMFLMVAEAAFKTGDEQTARQYLNAIRKRADSSASDITTSGEPLINAIYKERRKELCFENLRLYDLQRLGMGINRLDVLPGMPGTLTYPNNKAIAPIPQKDVDIAGLKQNEGY